MSESLGPDNTRPPIESELLNRSNDQLIHSLNAQVEFYKRENVRLRDVLQSQPAAADQTQPNAELHHEHKRLSDEAIANLNHQLRVLSTERDTLNTLWKTAERTCANQTAELQNYREANCESAAAAAIAKLRKEAGAANNAFKATIVELRRQLAEERRKVGQLEESKAQVVRSLSEIETTYKAFLAEQAAATQRTSATATNLQTAKQHIANMQLERSDLERRLRQSTAALHDNQERETRALQKIHEVLAIAETALAEKTAAQQREQELREECDHLATTIAQVLQEASAKCDEDSEQRHARYTETLGTLQSHIGQLSSTCDQQMEKVRRAEEKADEMQARLQQMMQVNGQLDADLETASRAIVDMEIRLSELEQLLASERQANRLNDERCAEMGAFLEQHRKLKQSWKSTVADISDKYELSCATNEELMTELRDMRSRLAREPQDFQYGDGHNVIVVTTGGGGGS